MYVIFDTETTGIPKSYKAPYTQTSNWPRLVELAWAIYTADGQQASAEVLVVKPQGFKIPADAARIHGITTEKATTQGKPLKEVLNAFVKSLPPELTTLVEHNIDYDRNIVGSEMYRLKGKSDSTATDFMAYPKFCTMRASMNYCKIPGRYGKYKFPTLDELYRKLFGEGFEKAHSALADVGACARCFFRLRELGVV